MSADLIDQLDAYGVWLEEHCATELRAVPTSTLAMISDTETHDVTEVEVESRSSLSTGRRLVLAAALVLVAVAAAALWSHRSAPTAPAGLPADPNGALFVLPQAEDGVVLSDAAIWTGTPDPAQTGAVHAVVVGRPAGDGYVDIVGISDSIGRPGPPSTDSWTQIDTATGTALVSIGGPPMAIQQRGDRWIRLTNVIDQQTIGELLQAITLTAERIAFEPVDGFAEVDTFTEQPALEHSTEYTAASADGTVTFTVSTATASSPLFAALLADQVQPVTINGHNGWLVTSKTDGGSMHGVVWQATANRIVGVSGNATNQQLVDFADRLQLVDEQTWTAALPGYSRQGP